MNLIRVETSIGRLYVVADSFTSAFNYVTKRYNENDIFNLELIPDIVHVVKKDEEVK